MSQMLAIAMLFLSPQMDRDTADSYAAQFVLSGTETGEDPFLLAALGFYESGWETDAESTRGACGVMQIMSHEKGTWRRRRPSCDSLKADAIANIELGARTLASYKKEAPEDLHLALCRYNEGPNSSGCKPGKTNDFSLGVIWTRDVLLRFAMWDPLGDMCCSVTLTVDGELLEGQDCFPVYSKEAPNAGRRFNRLRRSRIKDITKKASLTDACAIHDEESPAFKSCTHTRGKRYECEFKKR